MDAQSRVQEVVKQYVMSVNELDIEKAKTLWLEEPKISFVHPRGHEIGLEQIIHSFLQGTMSTGQRKPMILLRSLYVGLVRENATIVRQRVVIFTKPMAHHIFGYFRLLL